MPKIMLVIAIPFLAVCEFMVVALWLRLTAIRPFLRVLPGRDCPRNTKSANEDDRFVMAVGLRVEEAPGGGQSDVHIECHGMLGWAIGVVAKADVRLCRWCVLGALLPDLDSVSYLFGPEAYGKHHHTFGHSVFTGLLFCAAATAHCRSWKALGLSLLCFGSHLLTDAWLSGWLLYLFWPFSGKGCVFAHAVDLAHPVNLYLVYLSLVAPLALALVYRRTPIELLSPALDRLLVSTFSRATAVCHACGRKANLACARCAKPICSRHATIQRSWTVSCPDCGTEANANDRG